MSVNTIEPPAAPAATEPARAPATTRAKKAPPKGLRRWRMSMRRRYVIDRGYQYKMTTLSVYCVLLPLIAFNVLGYFHARAMTATAAAAAPQLHDQLLGQQQLTMMAYLAFSVLFLIGHVWLMILETHRTAGPAYHIARELEGLKNGRYDGKVQLRKTDHLVDLATSFNEAVQSIRVREAREVAELERLVGTLEASSPASAQALARLADEKRRRLT